MQSLLKGVEYHPVGALDLCIGPRVGNRDIPDIDPAVLTVLIGLVVVVAGTQVCDYAVG
jgi:hypothetical protein